VQAPFGGPNPPATSQFAHTMTFGVQDTSTYSLGDLGFLGDVTLKNIAAFRSVREANTFEALPIPIVSAQIPDVFQDIKQETEEAQLLGKRGNLDYIFGLFYFRESGLDGTDNYQLSTDLNEFGGYVKNISYSAFAHANYNLSSVVDGLSVTGGVRLNNDQRYLTYYNLVQTTATQYLCELSGLVISGYNYQRCAYPVSTSFHEPTWDVGLNQRIAPNSMVYALVSHGYRAGGFGESATTAVATLPYKPESLDNYEVGSKNDFKVAGVPTRLNASLYYSNYTNIQRTLTALAPNGTLANTTFNAAKAHIEGAEVELEVKPLPSLEVNAFYAFTYPKYDNFTDLVIDHGVAYPINVADSTFILASRNSFNLGARYTLPVNDRFGDVNVHANYTYRSSFYTTSDINTANCYAPGDPNVPPALYANCLNHLGKLPGYGLLNLRADWANVFGLGVDVALFIDNATNAYYFPGANNVYSALGAMAVFVGPPRMFGFELRVPFGASAYGRQNTRASN
jgi:iron complex outermembrane receptor protein